MRNDWMHKDELHLNIFHKSVCIDFTATGNEVVLLNRQELEEWVFKGLLIFHTVVIFGSLINTIVDGVLKDLVPQILRVL